MDRLLDPEDRVRAAAVCAVCGVAATDLALAGRGTLDEALRRLFDKKPAVRKEAAAALVGLYRSHCARCHEAGGTRAAGPAEQAVAWLHTALLSAVRCPCMCCLVLVRSFIMSDVLACRCLAKAMVAHRAPLADDDHVDKKHC